MAPGDCVAEGINEYSYFDNGRLGAWAGPKHWKFKAFAKPTLPNSGEVKKKAAKEAIGPMSFEDLFIEDSERRSANRSLAADRMTRAPGKLAAPRFRHCKTG